MANKTPLLILHGALGAQTQFDELDKRLASAYTLHRFNFSGHGGTPFENDFSIQQFTKELAAYIEAHELNNVNVFGYSMGGYVALSLANKHPGKLGKIFTLGTKFNWTPESATQEVKMLNPDKIEEKVPAFANVLAQRHAHNDWKEVLHKTKDLMLRLGDGEALTLENFSSIKNQVMIGLGDQDHMVTKEESQKIAAALPHGKFTLFKDFKHPIEQVDQQELIRELVSFFR